MILAVLLNDCDLSFGVGVEVVYRNYDGHAELLEVVDVNAEVHDTLFECFNIFLCEVGLCNAAVVLQRADSRYEHGAVRL